VLGLGGVEAAMNVGGADDRFVDIHWDDVEGFGHEW
jgi:hypothetical protein